MRSNTPSVRYIDILRLPHVPLTFGSAIVGRAAYALVILPLLFAVKEGTGSFAAAGVAVGVYGLAAALLAPLRAYLIDKYGRRRILMALSTAFGLSLSALAVASFVDASAPVMVALATGAGAVAPPLGPTMRVVWSELVREPASFKKALSLDAVIEELLYLAGPAVAGFALVLIAPGVALLAPAILVVLGTALFVSSSALKIVQTRSSNSDNSRSQIRRRSLLRDRRFVGVLLPALVAGLVAGHYTVAIPAVFSGAQGAATAGVALGLFAGGSALGGLVFGLLTIRFTAQAQLIMLTVGLVLLSSATSLFTDGFMICVTIAVAGLFFSPVMIVAYYAAHEFGGDDKKTQATTWVNTSHNVGGAAGSAVAGFLIQQTAVPTSYLFMGLVCLFIVVLAAITLRGPSPSASDDLEVPTHALEVE